ncbi:uncharacterized protein LOC111052839 isoform X2 [Nilaparvata lugens]|uniref:uncharacterized protein LOC111052839 isoform X2 n=1 Tax=Nilaparvata lugens TaxID=108931 RepID=UPI00193DB325|nr:uncharacterized protein LOC111052839 isoform X2 [Nilaparvata lugens]
MDDIQSWWEVPSIAHFCSLFRVAFNLLDFDIEELEEALLTDGTEDCGSSLLQELIVRLLCGIVGNNGISTFNYQMFLRRLFRQKCREYGRENPFNTDIDFQFLPLRTKVEILHALCDFRLDADDVLDVLKNLDSDSLRVHPLGYDENRSAYWYFYGTRLYREDYPKAKKKKKKPREREKVETKGGRGGKRRGRGAVTDDDGGSDDTSGAEGGGGGEMGLGQWQVVCYTEADWEQLAHDMADSRCKEERALHTVLNDDFLPEIPRLFEEKERLQRKRLMEMQPRRQSSRIEKLKHQKEEEKLRQAKLEKLERQRLERLKQEKEEKKDSASSRATRAMMRSRSSSECDGSLVTGGGEGGGEGGGTAPESGGGDHRPQGHGQGRQTNNSLASATGQIIIHQHPSRFKQSDEDVRTGLYKILDRLKNHDDAWPFVDPVEEEYAPRYYSVIARPMDLQRMEDKLDAGQYRSFGQFKADFQLIIDNCRQYNGSDNEYTEMASKLQEAFESAVERYLEVEVSTDEEVAVEFQGGGGGGDPKAGGGGRKRKGSEPREPRSPSESLPARSDDSDEELDRDLDRDDERDRDNAKEESGSDGGTSQTSGERRSRKRRRPGWQQKKGGGALKNVDAFAALELATEQTLKDISKWLDDTPRFSEFSSASNSPSQSQSMTTAAAAVALEDSDVAARIENDYRNRLKLDRPPRPRDYNRESQRRRLMKEQGFIKRRREIHRTIDRLQPGKSKGNLLSNLTTSKNNEETSVTANKDQKSNLTDVDESAPKLSLGTVLTSDVIGFGKHNFGENESRKENIDFLDDSNDDKKLVILDEDKKSPDSCVKSEDVADPPDEKKVKCEEEEEKKPLLAVKKKPVVAESGGGNCGGGAKQAPNLSAWFKAFGAPKSQPTVKKKPEEVRPISVLEESSKPSPRPEKVVNKEDEVVVVEEVERKVAVAVVPPLQSPARRQRKASTGSSVSERSSFSQDPNDPMIDGSSPRPSLDEPYLSPQSEPMKTPYHHSPVNGTIRVGFYQDTSFPRSNSSSSPRDPPSCSPRDPPSCSPRDHPDCSPHSYSPKHPVPSPKTTDYRSPFTPSTLPNYSAPVVTTSSAVCETPLYEAPLSPFPAHMPYYDTNKPIIDQYRSSVPVAPAQQQLPPKPQRLPTPPPVQAPPAVEKCMFPVKKRGYSDVDSMQHHQLQLQQQQQQKAVEEVPPPVTISEPYRGGSFAPTRGAVEQDRAFTPTPGRMPTSHAPTPVHHAYPPEATLNLGLSHHTLPPPRHPLDRFTNERLLQAPFFGADYSKTVRSAEQLMYPQTHASTTPTTSYPGKEPCHQYPGRPDLSEVTVPADYNRPPQTLSYPDPRAMKPSEVVSPGYNTAGRTSPSATALNYSRTSDSRSPSAINPSSPLNFSNADKRMSDTVITSSSSSPVTYMTRPQDLKRMPPTSQPLAYGKVVAPDLSSKVNVSSPLSYTSRQPMTDMIPGKVPSPFCGRPDLSEYTNPELVANKLSVPTPLSYAATQQELINKVNYSHPMSELMQSQARYNYPISELMQGKGYQAQISELMQGKSDLYGSRPGEHLLTSQSMYNYSGGRAVVKEAPVKSVAPPKKQTKKSKKAAAAAAAAAAGMEAAAASGFQQYQSQAASDAIALKSAASVVPGSAFNFGPAPHSLKDSYASYMDDIRSSGYYVPPQHQQPPDTTKSTSSVAAPPAPHPTFSFLGNSSRPPYPHPPHPHHPFINSPYQQYLPRHPEDILRPMVLHQGLLPGPSYPPGYLGIHDPIPRPSWL